MDFVVEILITVFHKTAADATRIMLDVHRKGKELWEFIHMTLPEAK